MNVRLHRRALGRELSVCVDRANRRCINLIAEGTIANNVLEVIRAKTEVFRKVMTETSLTLRTRATSGKYLRESSR